MGKIETGPILTELKGQADKKIDAQDHKAVGHFGLTEGLRRRQLAIGGGDLGTFPAKTLLNNTETQTAAIAVARAELTINFIVTQLNPRSRGGTTEILLKAGVFVVFAIQANLMSREHRDIRGSEILTCYLQTERGREHERDSKVAPIKIIGRSFADAILFKTELQLFQLNAKNKRPGFAIRAGDITELEGIIVAFAHQGITFGQGSSADAGSTH